MTVFSDELVERLHDAIQRDADGVKEELDHLIAELEAKYATASGEATRAQVVQELRAASQRRADELMPVAEKLLERRTDADLLGEAVTRAFR